MINAQLKKIEYDKAIRERDEAAVKLNERQWETIKEYMAVIEKIAFYSAGIFSLSVTFVGYFLKDNKPALTMVSLFGQPLYVFLFLSWLLLGVSFITSFYIRWLNANHLHAGVVNYWLKMGLKVLSAEKELWEVDYPIIPSEGGNKGENVEKIVTALTHNGAIQKDAEKLEEWSLFIRNTLIVLSSFCFVLGVLLLVFVAIKSVLNVLL